MTFGSCRARRGLMSQHNGRSDERDEQQGGCTHGVFKQCGVQWASRGVAFYDGAIVEREVLHSAGMRRYEGRLDTRGRLRPKGDGCQIVTLICVLQAPTQPNRLGTRFGGAPRILVE